MTHRASASIAAGIGGALGAAGLLAWLTGRMALASGSLRSIPMAPITAIAVLLLASALLALAAGRGRRFSISAGAIVWLFAIGKLSRFALGADILPDVEQLLVRTPHTFGAVPLARISPVTAFSLAALGAGVALLATTAPRRHRRDIAGGLGTVGVLIAGTVLLGYAYGTPLLYGGSIIPVALSTALAVGALSTAVILIGGGADQDGWPLRVFSGTRARARLLRTFLPATTATFLVAGAGGHVLVAGLDANPALAAALAALTAAVSVAVLVSWIARSVGDAIDRAEDDLKQSQHNLERAVEERTRQLTRANEELEAFSYSVSHDLRAPLRHISGFAALLEKSAGSGFDDQGRRYVHTIAGAASRMSRLVDDLLSFSRMGRVDMLRSTVDLNSLLDEVVADEMRAANGRTIDWKRQPLPAVSGDRAMLRTALSNLVANAVKYTATRERAEIEVGTLPDGGAERVLFVRDNGVGFDMQYVDKLFGVFQRLHSVEEFEGTGIGLANVRRVVARHGGRTWAEGALDRGATFYVALPGTGGDLLMMTDLKRILLAEDSANDVELTLAALAEHRIANQVDVVRDGVEALDYLYRRGRYASRQPDPPALVLLDLKMPKVTGLEVLQQIKVDPALKMIPVVMLTSSREEGDLIRSYQLGVNAYVVKPVDFPDFIDAVRQIGGFWAVINETPSMAAGARD